MMSKKLFKVLNEDGSCWNGGWGSWSLPTQNTDGTWEPGEWMPPIKGRLIACENGYHLCREGDLLEWLGPAIFTAEYRGDRQDDDDKIVVREARLLDRLDTWNDRTARLLACDCAERIVHLCDDPRSQQVIDIARRYANGTATEEELAAARAAAWVAARAAGDAAGDAAGGAAEDAEWIAARAVARVARVAWVAVDATWAAWDVARVAAWDTARAAWGAAWDTAWAAERKWQTKRLMEYLYD